ncbi:MAG: zinc-dependent alcohol dehydrogenase [Bacteroidota bacterium]
MRQEVMTSPGNVEIREVDVPPDPGPHEVMLNIKRIGVCGTDMHVYHGTHPATSYPVVQGHEYSAVVEKVGNGVTKVKPGDKATARPQQTCGVCGPCKRGHYNVCENLKVEGFQAPGVAQDYAILPEERLVRLPENMSFEQGAMVEPVAVGAHSTRRSHSLEGKNVVVSGAGMIGNVVAQFARIRGAKKVLITDVSDFRLEKARECGLEHTLNIEKEDFAEGVGEIFGEEKFQAGFEAAGVQSSLDNLIANVEKGGDVVILGVYGKNPVVNMFHVGEHELNLFGSLMYRHEDYEKTVAMLSEGKVLVDPLITSHFPFEQYQEAYKYIEEHGDRIMKVFINL